MLKRRDILILVKFDGVFRNNCYGVVSVVQFYVFVFIVQKLENSWRFFGMNFFNLLDFLSYLNCYSRFGDQLIQIDVQLKIIIQVIIYL